MKNKALHDATVVLLRGALEQLNNGTYKAHKADAALSTAHEHEGKLRPGRYITYNITLERDYTVHDE